MSSASEPLRRPVARRRILAVRDGRESWRPDDLAAEEPMEIRVQGPVGPAVPVAVTMRTPGADFELAAGFLFTEGLVDDPAEIRRVSYCEDLPADEQRYNVVTVRLARPFDPELVRRSSYVSSSCGVCGKASLEAVVVRCPAIAPGPVVKAEVLAGLPGALRAAQRVFDRTGGLHAAGLFAPDGTLLAAREDVGRHNAVDKVIGHAVLAGDLPLAGRILQVSGRLSFEIVQKAARAGVPILAAVSAPSSLAVEAAEELGVTVVGFVREGGFNVYAHAERVAR
ncbi:Sulfurtransferase FdhD [bacterium HR12]|nr:Sulfurtransferase FdhD [bacterium HR12]